MAASKSVTVYWWGN